MDLSQVSTDELRAELNARDERKREAEKEAFRRRYPCPDCGGDPVELDHRMVEEFRSAPRDDRGRPMLWMPYESWMGTTDGARWQTTLTCVNGHVTTSYEIKWYDKPIKGPPLLPR